MNRSLPRLGSSLILLCLGVSLILYGYATKKVSVQDIEFCRTSIFTSLFPECWLLRGNFSVLVDVDTAGSIELFRQAISVQPLKMEAWFALARAEMLMGRVSEARGIMGLVADTLTNVSTWKWQEFLLAAEIRDETRFASCFNFILCRLPSRIPEACYLAVQYWGSWSSVLPHVLPQGQAIFLSQLMGAGEVDASLDLWRIMEANGEAANDQLRLRMCEFLIRAGRMKDAKAVWKVWRGVVERLVFDGGFEMEPLNTAFGWRVDRQPKDVMMDRSLQQPFRGSYSFHFHFRGSGNVNFSHVYQIVPVEPGRTYTLRYARKSRGITTDQGVYLELQGYQCKGLQVGSEPLVGTSDWAREEMDIPVPEGCEALMMRVRRNESLKFNNKIAGDFWLDEVELLAK